MYTMLQLESPIADTGCKSCPKKRIRLGVFDVNLFFSFFSAGFSEG